MENEIAGALTQADFGLVALFLRAGIVVKIVMTILIIASIWAWSVVIGKSILLRKVRGQLIEFSQVFWSGTPLDEIAEAVNVHSENDAERVFQAGMKEWRKNIKPSGKIMDGADERIERAMNVSLTASRSYWEDGLNALSTIGATAPFIGLFGTVWGIKNSFQDIAMHGSTNLAVVAPGIAEALVATALGLVAAIPAVIFYNKFNNDVEKIATDHASFAEEFALHISREINASKTL